MFPYKVSRFVVLTDPFEDPTTGELIRIIFGARKGYWKRVQDSEWPCIKGMEFDHLREGLVQELIDNEILVPSDEDELATILNANQESIRDLRELYLVVQPTDWCQLGCDYCGQSHGSRQMDESDQRAFVARVESKIKTSNFDSIRVGWFGAEPLAAMRVIRGLSHKLIGMARRHQSEYSSLVVTNGLLLSPEVATELVGNLHVDLIEVTLDGCSEYHDSRRAFKSGDPSFERIYKNVCALALRDDLNVDLRVRCNVDFRNKDGILPLIQRMADDELADRLSFYVAPVHSWGNDAGNLLDIEEYAAWEIEWIAHLAMLGFKPKLIPGRIKIVCMALKPEAELIDAAGSLFNCTEVSYVSAYVGEAGRSFAANIKLPIVGAPTKLSSNIYSIGNLGDGEIPGKRGLLSRFNERVAAGEYTCAQCNLFPTCGGSCPKLWLEGTCRCPSEKYNFQQRLILAYLLTCQGKRIERITGNLTGV
jgi:uncharacterized protein